MKYCYRTKALAIELLSAICLVNDGHELVINAFTKFQVHIFLYYYMNCGFLARVQREIEV